MKLVMNANSAIHDHIAVIITTIDEHDAGILDGVYMCPCKFQGTEQQWHSHIADLITSKIAKQSAA